MHTMSTKLQKLFWAKQDLWEWKLYNAACIKEYNGILDKGTFSIIPIPKGSKIIPT